MSNIYITITDLDAADRNKSININFPEYEPEEVRFSIEKIFENLSSKEDLIRAKTLIELRICPFALSGIDALDVSQLSDLLLYAMLMIKLRGGNFNLGKITIQIADVLTDVENAIEEEKKESEIDREIERLKDRINYLNKEKREFKGGKK